MKRRRHHLPEDLYLRQRALTLFYLYYSELQQNVYIYRLSKDLHAQLDYYLFAAVPTGLLESEEDE